MYIIEVKRKWSTPKCVRVCVQNVLDETAEVITGSITSIIESPDMYVCCGCIVGACMHACVSMCLCWKYCDVFVPKKLLPLSMHHNKCLHTIKYVPQQVPPHH